MKNFTFLVALFFIGWTSYASSANNPRPYYGEAFIFIEGGVEFAVYPNGEFDFYYNPRFIDTSPLQIGHPGYNISYNAGYNYDAFVQFDDFGAVIQIENVPVFYDYYGRLIQAGDVVIYYDNAGRIARIGGMKIRYNSFNQPVRYVGHINRFNMGYVYRPWHRYYVRPHVSHRIVYYEPYRAYYEPLRMNYIQYSNYYQNNNYYYNKSNFYRPGQQVANYNYGRRTVSPKEEAPSPRSNRNTTREYANNIADSPEIRSNRNSNRTSGNSFNRARERRNLELHESAVRNQQNSSGMQSRGRLSETRSSSRQAASVESNVRLRTAERNPDVGSATVRQRENTTAVRRNSRDNNSNVRAQTTQNNNRSSVRSRENTNVRSNNAQPASREASRGRRSSGIRG